jgi:hypothetical protein
VAIRWANKSNPAGVLLVKLFPAALVVSSPDVWFEEEALTLGEVDDAKVIIQADFQLLLT